MDKYMVVDIVTGESQKIGKYFGVDKHIGTLTEARTCIAELNKERFIIIKLNCIGGL